MNEEKIKREVDMHCKMLDPFLGPVIDQIMDKVDLSTLPPAGTHSMEEKQVKYRESFIDLVYDRGGIYYIRKGFSLIMENLHRVPAGTLIRKELTKIGLKQLEDIHEAMQGQPDQVLHYIKWLQNQLSQDPRNAEQKPQPNSKAPNVGLDLVSIREEWGLSDPAFQAMYEIGCQLYVEKHIEEAISVYSVLSLLDFQCHEVWFSLGLCFKQKHDWLQAIANYALAVVTRPANMDSYLHLSVCYAAIHDSPNATYMLTIAEAMLQKVKMDSSERNRIHHQLVKLRRSIR